VVRLYRDCLGKVCPDGQTCVQGGACVSEQVQCQGTSCGVADEKPFAAPADAGDGGGAIDGGTEPGGPDASTPRCRGPSGDDVLLENVVPAPTFTRASDTAVYWVTSQAGGAGISRVSKTPPKGAAAQAEELVAPTAGSRVTAFALESDLVWYTLMPSGELFEPTSAKSWGTPISTTPAGALEITALTFSSSMNGIFASDGTHLFLYRRNESFDTFYTLGAKALAAGKSRLFIIDANSLLFSKTFDNVPPSSLTALADALVVDDDGGFAAVRVQAGQADVQVLGDTALSPHVTAAASSVLEMALDTAGVYWLGDGKISRAGRSTLGGSVTGVPVLAGTPTMQILHFSVDSSPSGCVYYWTTNPQATGASKSATLRVAPKGP
jgi:hypothetical protein